MPDDAPLLRIPPRHRSVADALGTAGKLNLTNIVILSETEAGLVLISAGTDELLTAAQVLWLLESGKNLLFRPEPYEG